MVTKLKVMLKQSPSEIRPKTWSLLGNFFCKKFHLRKITEKTLIAKIFSAGKPTESYLDQNEVILSRGWGSLIGVMQHWSFSRTEEPKSENSNRRNVSADQNILISQNCVAKERHNKNSLVSQKVVDKNMWLQRALCLTSEWNISSKAKLASLSVLASSM